jgi:hypothetical protein
VVLPNLRTGSEQTTNGPFAKTGGQIVSATSPTIPTTPPTPVTSEYPVPTEADHEAMFASIAWFRTQAPGAFEQYAGKHVAISGEQILDADSNLEELVHRLDALGNRIPPNCLVLQWIHSLEDLLRY